jgi:50S ribosomal protein L16 3-hydroxylase
MADNWRLNLDVDAFLAQYWQRKPLVIRDAIANFRPPTSRHQLAGLALEDEVESRIIEYVENQWLLHHGPFSDVDFQRPHPWTLLVQAVDQYLPEVAQLRKIVDFIPQWRVDDVMVSYAADGGSVGPHFDNYDVFLLQGEGERLWQLGQFCDDTSPLVPHDDLRILSVFESTEEHLLGPGDMLYVPPGVAHWGVARGDCTTFSIGFRSPRLSDMVSRWADQLLEQLDPQLFYRDAGLSRTIRPGEIGPQDMAQALAQLEAALEQVKGNHWFGELVTEPRYEQHPDKDDLANAAALLTEGATVIDLSPSAKVAWQQEEDGITVFANGQGRVYASSVLPTLLVLCAHWRLADNELMQALDDPNTVACLDWLLRSGCLYVE